MISPSTRYINQTKGGLVHWEQKISCFQYKSGRVSIPVESTGTVEAAYAREMRRINISGNIKKLTLILEYIPQALYKDFRLYVKKYKRKGCGWHFGIHIILQ